MACLSVFSHPAMDNLLPSFRPATSTYYGMKIPLVETQVKASNKGGPVAGKHFPMKTSTVPGSYTSSTNRQQDRHRRGPASSSTLCFRRPFDAVRLQPVLGCEPRRDPRQYGRQVNSKTGWDFHTAGTSVYEYEFDGRRGVFEYDGYEESSGTVRTLNPTQVRHIPRRDRSLSPPRLMQAAMDAVKLDCKKPSTAPANTQRRAVFDGQQKNEVETGPRPVDLTDSGNSPKKIKRRPATASGMRDRARLGDVAATVRPPRWGYKRGGKFNPTFKAQPKPRDENDGLVGDKKPVAKRQMPPVIVRIANLQPVKSTVYFSTAKGIMKVLMCRPGHSVETTSSLKGGIKLHNLQTPPLLSPSAGGSRRRPVSAAASRRQSSEMVEKQVAKTTDGLYFAFVPRNMLGQFRSRDDKVACTIKFSNHDISPFQIYWINYEGRKFPRMLLRPGDSYVESSFATHPWFVQHAESERTEGLCIVLGDTVCTSLETYSVVYNPPNRQWKKPGKLSLSVGNKSSGNASTNDQKTSSRPSSAKQKLKKDVGIPTSIPVTISIAIVPSYKLR